MIPSIGRVVHYRLTETDAVAINKRRTDASASAIATANTGAIVHSGNSVSAGQVFPLIITRIWAHGDATETTSVNGQVLLDGNDSLWVSSVNQGTKQREWSDPREA